ncbi:MAG: AraC family transcriptional regulator [Burkholderiaceae bacterium]
MDALSELLKATHLTGATFIAAELKAPWFFRAPPSQAIAAALMPEADHIVPYHLIGAGACFVSLDDGPMLELAAGDVVIFPHGDQHSLGGSSQPVPDTLTVSDLSRLVSRGETIPVRGGGDGATTELICGFLACNQRLCQPLLIGLPRVIRVSLNDDPGAAWLRDTLRFSANESAHPRAGSALMLARLSELIFVEALRRYIDAATDARTGWLAALRDRHIALALGRLHGSPGQAWTVDALARTAGLSRSVFADRFTQCLGQPPMQYLATWRLTLAADQLRSGKVSIGRIAEQVGYESEASFTRAFKREFGLPPATWRRTQEPAGPAAPVSPR